MRAPKTCPFYGVLRTLISRKAHFSTDSSSEPVWKGVWNLHVCEDTTQPLLNSQQGDGAEELEEEGGLSPGDNLCPDLQELFPYTAQKVTTWWRLPRQRKQ